MKKLVYTEVTPDREWDLIFRLSKTKLSSIPFATISCSNLISLVLISLTQVGEVQIR